MHNVENNLWRENYHILVNGTISMLENMGKNTVEFNNPVIEYFSLSEIEKNIDYYISPLINDWISGIYDELNSLNFTFPQGYSYKTYEKLKESNIKLLDFIDNDIYDKISEIKGLNRKHFDLIKNKAREEILNLILDITSINFKWCDRKLYWSEKIEEIAFRKIIKTISDCKKHFPFLSHKDKEIKNYWDEWLKIYLNENIEKSERYQKNKDRTQCDIYNELNDLKRTTIELLLKTFENDDDKNNKRLFGNLIDFSELKQRISDIDLISGEKMKFDKNVTYSVVEMQSESKTHKNMRQTAIEFFLRQGYDVCPDTIGVKGIYTLVDLAIIKNSELIFVECLTDKSITRDILNKKVKVMRYGKLCFIFVGGSGYATNFIQDSHELHDEIGNIPDDILVYLYYYGNWYNNFEKRIEEYSKELPEKFWKSVRIKIDMKMKRKYCYINMDITYCNRIKNRNYNLPSQFYKLLFEYDGRKFYKRDFRIGNVNELYKIEEFIEKSKDYFTVICDENILEYYRKKLLSFTKQDKDNNLIDSNLPIEDRIVWALDRIFSNEPTNIHELSDIIGLDSISLNYYLKKGVTHNKLKRVKRGYYIASNEGILNVEKDLKEKREMLVDHPKHGQYVETFCYYIKFKNMIEGHFDNSIE